MARRPMSPCYKVVLCGQYGVGKTSILRRFMDDSFIPEDDSSRSRLDYCNGLPSVPSTLDHHRRQFHTRSGRAIELELWDTAGLERFRTMSASYYSGASAAIVCYSVNDRDSLSAAADYVVEALEAFGRSDCSVGAVIFLCGTKTDCATAKDGEISKSMVDCLASEYEHVVCRTFRVSCKTGDGLTNIFNTIAETLDNRALDKVGRTSGIVLEAVDHGEQRNYSSCAC